nr:unnamed protein product [Callosobruchus analis]
MYLSMLILSKYRFFRWWYSCRNSDCSATCPTPGGDRIAHITTHGTAHHRGECRWCTGQGSS